MEERMSKMKKTIGKLGLLLLVLCMLASLMAPAVFAVDTSRIMLQEDFQERTTGSYGPYVTCPGGIMSVVDLDGTKYLSVKNNLPTAYGAVIAHKFDTQYGQIKKGGVPLAVLEWDVGSNLTGDGKLYQVQLVMKDSTGAQKYVCVAIVGGKSVVVPDEGKHDNVDISTGPKGERIVTNVANVGRDWLRFRVEVDTAAAKFRTTVLNRDGVQIGQSGWKVLHRDAYIYTLAADSKEEVVGLYAAVANNQTNNMYVDNVKFYESRPTVTASFNEEQGDVTISGDDVEGNAVRYGKSAAIAVTAKQGFDIEAVSVQSGTAQPQDFGKQTSFNLENITEDTVVNVTFKEKPVQEPSVSGPAQVSTIKNFTYGDDPTPYNSAVVFSTIVVPDGWELTDDYGIQFTGGDVTDYKLVAFANATGQFGIRIYGEGLETGKTYTVRAYAVLKNTATQETKTVTEAAPGRSFTIEE